MKKDVKATVAAIISKSDNDVEKILLTRRTVNPFAGMLCLPGGHIDRFETAKDAVIREVKEETGLDFAPRFFYYFDEILETIDFHAVVIAFVGNASGTLVPQPDEVSEVYWLSVAEAQKHQLAFQHNEIIAAYAAAQTNP
jgi:8-oxo-dGTP diphosphatase